MKVRATRNPDGKNCPAVRTVAGCSAKKVFQHAVDHAKGTGWSYRDHQKRSGRHRATQTVSFCGGKACRNHGDAHGLFLN